MTEDWGAKKSLSMEALNDMESDIAKFIKSYMSDYPTIRLSDMDAKIKSEFPLATAQEIAEGYARSFKR